MPGLRGLRVVWQVWKLQFELLAMCTLCGRRWFHPGPSTTGN